MTDFFTESSLAVEIASDTKLSSWMEEYVCDSKKNRVENVLTLLYIKMTSEQNFISIAMNVLKLQF